MSARADSTQTRGRRGVARGGCSRPFDAPGDGWDRRESRVRRRARCEGSNRSARRVSSGRGQAPSANARPRRRLATARSVPNVCRLARDLVGTGRRPRVATFASAADRDPPPPPTEEDVEAATRKWLDETVIGLNLCPFARAPVPGLAGSRSGCRERAHPDDLFAEFTAEAKRLAKTYTDADAAYGEEDDDADDASTTDDDASRSPRPRCSAGAERAGDGARFHPLPRPSSAVAAMILEELDLVGYIQLATFHPHYQFEGEEVADPGSYTNRSPYPTIHLLRAVGQCRERWIRSRMPSRSGPERRETPYHRPRTAVRYPSVADPAAGGRDRDDESSNGARLDEGEGGGGEGYGEWDEIAKTLFETSDVDRAKSQVLRFLNYKPRTRAELRRNSSTISCTTRRSRTRRWITCRYGGSIGRGLRGAVCADEVANVQVGTRADPFGAQAARDSREGRARGSDEGVRRRRQRGGGERRVRATRNGVRGAPGGESAWGGERPTTKDYELFLAAQKRWALSGGMDSEKRRRRLVGWLQRRGHVSLIQRIMDSLEG